mgnify:CR=1 FL=1
MKDAHIDHRLIDGKAVMSRILDEVSAYFVQAAIGGRVARDSPEVAVYVRNQARAAVKAGIRFDQELWSNEVSQDECKQLISEMNDDPEVLGIILQRPVPDHINVRSLQSAIHPLKDVEGMNPASIGNIVYSDMALAPCTAAAAVTLKGLEVVMIGHSEIVGKPVALLLMAEGATVTVCHHMTRSLAIHSRRADVLVVAVGKPHLIGAEMVKPGAVVIDIGINHVVGSDGKSQIVGDVDTSAVKEIAGWVTPVPGGVGPVTVAMLMRNAMTAHQRQQAVGWIQ